MAELLLRVVDRGPHALCTKAGDVIDYRPDGHPWSQTELNNPAWRIIRVPLTTVECDSLTEPKRLGEGLPTTHARARRLELSGYTLPPVGSIIVLDRVTLLAMVREK